MADDESGRGVVTSGSLALSCNGDFRSGGSQDIEGDFTQDGEVFWAVVLAVAGAVLIKGGVEHPVEAVLDAPMRSHGLGERKGEER